MARLTLYTRTPRACEHCRKTRRRCETPHPCRQCVAAGIPCDVRAKARPQRRQQHPPEASTPRSDDKRVESSSGRRSSSNKSAGHDNVRSRPTVQQSSCVDESRPSGEKTQSDTFELLKGLVQDMLVKRHGYVLNCALVEPPLYDPEAAGSPFARLAQSNARPPVPLSLDHTWNLLAEFQKLMGWQDTKLVDIEHLHATARTLIGHLIDLSPGVVSMTVATHRLPVDAVALMFIALALGAIAAGELGHGQFYFDISTEMIKHFTGQSTLELCLALFLQHVFALRVGTLSYAQGIIVQAIQNAHDLGLHRNTYGIPGLQLYLLIYMADQYCSLTHNTEPIIRISKLQGHIFTPLGDAKPQLQTLIDLVTINGYIIEHVHQRPDPSQDEILELEAKIGGLCSRLTGPVPAPASGGGFRNAYEPLARVHMLCCRMKLRAPGLSEQAVWLPSLCICVHAAEGVLSAYFQLHRPVLAALVRQDTAPDANSCTEKSLMPIACQLATTWRQVKRIMMSAFVIVFAYWHGEMMQEEASRYVAMARLLLEYPRWRWGEKLDEAVQTLVDISSLSDFRLYEHTQLLLPGATEQFLRPVRDMDARSPGTVRDLAPDPMGTRDETFTPLAPWYSVFDAVSTEASLASNVGTFPHQSWFGLWESIECPVEAGSSSS